MRRRRRMTSHYSHVVVNTCDQIQVKINCVAELLLLSGNICPVHSDATASVNNSLLKAKDKLYSSLDLVTDSLKNLSSTFCDFKVKWREACEELNILGLQVVAVIELCSYILYHVLSSYPNCRPVENSLIDKYSVAYAGLEIRLSCNRLKRARHEELTSQFIMDLCTNISKHISLLTDHCRQASQVAQNSSTRDQYKLCIKSVTCAAGCLIASVKSFKGDNSPTHHSRVLVFCDPVLAASHALVCFATEEEFVGSQAHLTDEVRDIQKSLSGPCMNIASACVQVCKAVREFSYNTSSNHYLQRLKSCIETIEKSSVRLREEMDLFYSTVNENLLSVKLPHNTCRSTSGLGDQASMDSLSQSALTSYGTENQSALGSDGAENQSITGIDTADVSPPSSAGGSDGSVYSALSR